MATKQELQKKYVNCKFAPKNMNEQKDIIKKLHEIGFISNMPWNDERLRCIYTCSDLTIISSPIECMYDLNYFINHKNTLTEANDLLNETINRPLTIDDLKVIKIYGENKNVMIFEYLYNYIQDFSEDFSTFMQAGEALAAALDIVVLFSVRNEVNPGIGWSKESYNQDINPWIDFLNNTSECIEDDIIKLMENYPTKVKIEINL